MHPLAAFLTERFSTKAPPMSQRLVLENINKNFGSLIAVKDVNLNIEPGEFLCFLGPSGCGKTTLLRIITGFEQPSSGTLTYDGKII